MVESFVADGEDDLAVTPMPQVRGLGLWPRLALHLGPADTELRPQGSVLQVWGQHNSSRGQRG